MPTECQQIVTPYDRAVEYAATLDEVIVFRKAFMNSYLVIGTKNNRLKYMEFKDYI